MEAKNRIVDTREYIDILKGLLEDGNSVNLLVKGGSMLPFIAGGRDSVYIEPVSKKKPGKGDIVLYQRDSGQYVLHRIISTCDGGFAITGDAQVEIEMPVREDQIFGVVTKLQRKGKTTGPGDFWWTFFRYIWPRMIPLRHPIMNAYGKIFHRNTAGDL